MKDDKKHLNIDLDFLDKEGKKTKPATSGDDQEKEGPASNEASPTENQDVPAAPSGTKYNWKNIIIVGVVVLLIGWAIVSGSSSNTSTTPVSTDVPTYNNSVSNTDTTYTPPVVNADTPITPITPVKTDSQICASDYGSHSYSTGKKNTNGGPVCDCKSGYAWNSTQTACVVAPPPPKTGYEICQDRSGPYATYDSASNSCGCASGYTVSATTNQCVDALTARDDSCAASYPGTSFLKYDTTTGKNICDCKAGYDWNNGRTACYTTTSFTQSCVNSYGTGAYSTTENGKRVCDCGYGYSFNAQRNMCVTTASINAICERDVGRNSTYDGTVTNGKYNCTQPY